MNRVMALHDLDLRTRTYNSLKSVGIDTVDELCARRPEYLLGIWYFGTGQLADVQRALAQHGMRLAPSLPPPLVSARQVAQRARRARERAARAGASVGPLVAVTAWRAARRGQA